MHNLFLLLHLFVRHIKGNEPLVDYSQSDVITFDQYLNIMWKKAMDKVIVKEIREDKQQEREDKKLKRGTYVGSTMDRVAFN
jgi:hypothetical protein